MPVQQQTRRTATCVCRVYTALFFILSAFLRFILFSLNSVRVDFTAISVIVIIIITRSSRIMEVTTKEEGEITDDDDDTQVAGLAVPVEQGQPAKQGFGDLCRVYNSPKYTRNSARNRRRRPVNVHNDVNRSSVSRQIPGRISVTTPKTTTPVQEMVPVSAVKETKPDLEVRPDSCTSASPVTSTSTSTDLMSLPLPSLSPPQSRFKMTWKKFSSQSRLASRNVTEKTFMDEIISISDSDMDVSDDSDVQMIEMRQDDDDLDELLLFRDALMSVVESKKSQKKMNSPLSTDVCSLSSEWQHFDDIDLSFISKVPDLLDMQHHNSSNLPCVKTSPCASDSADVSGAVFPAISSSSRSHLSENVTFLSEFDQQGDTTLSNTLSQSELHALPLTDSTPINSVAVKGPALPVSQAVQQTYVDNFEEVEMDLDSGSDFENAVVSSFEQPSELTTNTTDQNFSQNQNAHTLVSLPLSSTTSTTDSVRPLMSINLSSDAVASQPSVRYPVTDSSNNMLESQVADAGTGHDDKIPALMDIKTEMVDSGISGNYQQRRKVKNADKKELLLRAAVLQSLSNKRQQQQQSQLDTASYVHHDMVKPTKPQVTTHSMKRIITSSSSSDLTVQLPVPRHPAVVVSLTGESSESDNEEEQLEIPHSYNQSSTSVRDSSVAMSNNLDRFLREMRKATDEPKSQDCDTAPFHQAVAASVGKFEEMHNISKSALPSSSLIMKNLAVSGSTGISSSTHLNAKDGSLQKITLCNLEKRISHEKTKLHQQKIVLSKTKFKMARKLEQISAAEKRIKKLQEQLVAAQKITASSKKQLGTLREETLTLCRGIEQCQKTISRLEAELHMAQMDPEDGSDLENFLSSECLPAKLQPQLSDTAVHRKWGISVAEGESSYHVHSGAIVSRSDSVTCTTGGDVSKPSLFTTLESLPVQNSSSFVMTDKANMSDRSKKLRNINAMGARESECNRTLMQNMHVRRYLTSAVKGDEVGKTQTLTKTASHTVGSPSVTGQPTVIQDSSLDDHLLSKSISVTNPDIPTQKKSVGMSVSNLGVVSDDTSTGYMCASSGEITIPSDKKIKQVIQHYRSTLDRDMSPFLLTPSCQLFVSDPVFSFRFPVVVTSSVIANVLAADAKSDAKLGDVYRAYHSSLLCFRSYRFSDFYHQKEGLSVLSETFSHKLDCRVPLCQFDLMGKCLDDNCPWQHRSDYRLNDRECLVDIVSYCPSVADVRNSTPIITYENALNQYVDTFLQDTSVLLSHSEQCLRLIDHIKVAVGCSYPADAVFTTARCWKLHAAKQHSGASDRNDFLFTLDDVPGISLHESVADDVRYWMVAESDQIKNLEEAITNTPNDDCLWIKLAYAKMMEMKWCESHDECISYGLNVLTRAVEANPSNSRLWTHYLDLYMQRSNAESDVSLLYEQAIQYAPSYEFFWKYLQLPASYSQKMSLSKRLRQYLCSPMCCDDAEMRSHHLLETVLYQAALCTMSGRLKDGLQVIQAIVQSKASVIWLWLTPSDRIAMWLSFIHLYECRQLPAVLFDPANSNPGPIVRKEPFIVPFWVGTKTRISYRTLLQLFQSAFSACDKDITTGSESHDNCSLWLAALHRSRILLEVSCRGLLVGRKLCEEFLRQRPHLTDAWLCLIQLIVASRESSTDTADIRTVGSSISSTVEKAVANNPRSVMLYLTGISALIECGDSDAALSFAERCPISLYEVDQLDATSVDPNLLYSCLLGQPVPPNYKAPVLHPSVSRQYVADQQANLWLSYCLLLDLQGAHDQASQTYHLALSSLTETKDIRRMWVAFLRRSAAVICQQLPWLSPAQSFDQKRKLWQQFELDTHQALSSLPVRCSLPLSSQLWDDYSCHNQIIQLYVSCLSDVDVVQQACEKYVRQMPGNVELQLRTVKHLLDREMLQLCHGMCLVALHSCPKAALLWNTCLRLSEATDNVGLTRALYAKATTMLPFSASLWKLCIMFEVMNKSREHVKEALEKCRDTQVNVAGFVDSLLR